MKPVTMYARTSARVREAKAALDLAKRDYDRARKAQAHGTSAVRFQDWRPNIERAECAELHGDSLAIRRICHKRSYGRFVTLAVRAEDCPPDRPRGQLCGRIGGATFYRTFDDAHADWKASRFPKEAIFGKGRRR